MFDEVDLPPALESLDVAGTEHLSRKIKALERLLDISRQVSSLDRKTVLKLIMKNIIEMTRSKRGVLMTCRADGQLNFEFSVNLERDEVDSEEFDISRSIVRRALETGEVVVTKNLPSANLSNQSSFLLLGLKAVMAIPLKVKDRVLGVIYIDTDSSDHKMLDGDLSIFNGFGSQAAIAIENARLHENLKDDYFLLKKSVTESFSFDNIIYQSQAMHRVCESIRQVVSNDITVLVQGETGTGKELVARAIHFNGPRKDQRFLSQNAGALPDTILESELFGHRRGSFSGAVENKTGLFEVADGGTVFLDEIGEASSALQVRLLRLLETGAFRRVGDTTSRSTDVRIVAATNRDLKKEVEEGRFREDLYYRLSVFPITLPPLRQRKDDIPILVRHFVEEYNKQLKKSVSFIPKRVLAALMANEWKGNIRELKNQVYRMMVLAPPEATSLSEECLSMDAPRSGPTGAEQDHGSGDKGDPPRIRTLEEVEREHIREVLSMVGGNQVQAARHLGLNRSTLRWRLKKLGLLPGQTR